MASTLPSVDLFFPKSSKLLARLFFRTAREVSDFLNKVGCPMALRPIGFIYINSLYWQKGKPFLLNNELAEFKPDDVNCLVEDDYKQLYREILQMAEVINTPKPPPRHAKTFHTHVIGVSVGNFDGIVQPLYPDSRILEEKIIDQLDLPGLENSLNEAVRIENYEAAAYIKNKIQNSGHIIFEDKGRIKIKNPDECTGKDFNNLWYPSRD